MLIFPRGIKVDDLLYFQFPLEKRLSKNIGRWVYSRGNWSNFLYWKVRYFFLRSLIIFRNLSVFLITFPYSRMSPLSAFENSARRDFVNRAAEKYVPLWERILKLKYLSYVRDFSLPLSNGMVDDWYFCLNPLCAAERAGLNLSSIKFHNL